MGMSRGLLLGLASCLWFYGAGGCDFARLHEFADIAADQTRSELAGIDVGDCVGGF